MTTVQLITHTAHPLETIYLLWEASRHNEPIGSAANLAYMRKDSEMAEWELNGKIRDTFRSVIQSGIPVAENVSFTFLLSDVPISLREQMVRHRIGVHMGDNFGVDIVPDLADSTWWSQSMRILDMGRFAAEERYHVPQTVRDAVTTIAVRRPCPCHGALKDCTACKEKGWQIVEIPVEEFYREQMGWIQSAYTRMIKAGVPMEDAREILPLGATHRISWTLNLAALMHIVGKRGCWILQLGIWEPVIRGMIEALAGAIDPIFRELISPPCMKGDKFIGCKFVLDNERRCEGEDTIPPCSLFLHHHNAEAIAAMKKGDAFVLSQRDGVETGGYAFKNHDASERYDRMKAQYGALWGRDVFTGVRLTVEGRDATA